MCEREDSGTNSAYERAVLGFRKRVKHSLERLTGWKIERLGARSFALVDKKHMGDACFSSHTQIRSIIEKYDIDLVIDVGANEGHFAKMLRSFYVGEIHSFEPVLSTFQKLARAASSDPNWHVHNFALGSNKSSQIINVSRASCFSSLLKAAAYCAERFGGEALGRKEEVVSVRRLDELLQEIAPDLENKRIFIKMDTQGYDLEVFQGLGTTLKQVIAIQSEVSCIPIYTGMPHWTESVLAYERAGFGVVGMFPVTRDLDRVIEYDCLLIRVAAPSAPERPVFESRHGVPNSRPCSEPGDGSVQDSSGSASTC